MKPKASEHRDQRRIDAGPLAARLQDWRKRRDATHDHSALAARVIGALHVDATLVPMRPVTLSRDRWVERATWFSTGLAAAVAVAWFAWPTHRLDTAANWPPTVRFATGQLAEKTALVAGMEATFGADLAWIAEHDRRVDVGLVPGNASGEPVAVRIVILTRRVGESVWQPAWQSDVLARDEQVVDVAAGPGGGGRLRLWAHALADGAFAIDCDLSLTDATLPFAAGYSGVQRPGEPRRVTGDRTKDVEWQIIQTVAPLAPGGRLQGKVG